MTVLVVDDEESYHRVTAKYLKPYRVLRAYNGWQAVEMLGKHHIDIVLLDLNLPDTTGFKLLDQMRSERDDVQVIVVTAHSELKNAVEAVKRGAFDFLPKSYEGYQQLPQYIHRAMEHRRWVREQLEQRTQLSWLRDAFQVLENSSSATVRELMKLARQVADTPINVLIEGESGVGKEILARYVHAVSERAGGPFVPVNLSAVPSALLESHLFGHVKGAFTGAESNHIGKFELADGGCIFLDEIGELSMEAQVKLLRVLQEREIERVGARETSPIDVRVIAATNKELQQEVNEGRFREDLFFRLNVVRIKVPPLRERKEDLPGMAQLLAAKHAAVMQRQAPTYSRDAMEVLVNYDWPGNVRELENLVMRLVAVHPGKAITADDIPPEYCLASLNQVARTAAERDVRRSGKRLYFVARDQFERYLVRLVIKRCGGDKRAAARALGVSYSTIKEKVKGDETATAAILNGL